MVEKHQNSLSHKKKIVVIILSLAKKNHKIKDLSQLDALIT